MSRPKETEEEEAKRAFAEGVLARGEAAPASDDELPAGATHEVVEDDDADDRPTVRRRRFSAF